MEKTDLSELKEISNLKRIIQYCFEFFIEISSKNNKLNLSGLNGVIAKTSTLAPNCYLRFSCLVEETYQYFVYLLEHVTLKASKKQNENNVETVSDSIFLTWLWHKQVDLYGKIKRRLNQWN